jgi:DNA-nicking Smr family endonuclease
MKKQLDPDDIALFRKSVRDAKPIQDDRVEPYKPSPEAEPKQLQRDEAEAMQDLLSGYYDAEQLNQADSIQFHRPGLQHSILRKLRRGQYSIGGELDLHGMTLNQARAALLNFVNEAKQSGNHCVRIIHGKGLRSSNNGPVLKPMVAKWLTQLGDVLAYCSARPQDGGSGAVYVLLKK